MEIITQEKLKNILEEALIKLYTKDSYLLEHNCQERSITHKLAEYLQVLLPNYNVDCEYNLDIDNDNKRKQWISENVVKEIRNEIEEIKNSLKKDNWNLSEEIEKLCKSFYPDIIVHKRGSNKYNMLVIEAKKGNANVNLDIEKLKALTKQEGAIHYRYSLGAQIKFDIGETLNGRKFTNPIYYINGQEEQE